MQIEVNRRTHVWTRNWILQRNDLGTSNNLLLELSVEDPKEFFLALRMSENSFDNNHVHLLMRSTST